MRNYLIAGLTGPTGSGKSTVSWEFEKAGFAVINADLVAREIMQPDSVCLKQLALVFGDDIILPDGSADRRLIALRAFSSPENTAILNDITHPQIFLRTLKRCREFINSGKSRILFDAPVLFESNFDLMCDVVISVIAAQEVRLKRLIERDGITEQEVRRRMSAQKSNDFYTLRSDHVINGGQTLECVRARAAEIIKIL